MTTQTGGIKVRILGDDSDLNKKLTESRKAMSKWATAAVAASAAAAVAITKSTADTSKEITNLSRLVGENTTEFQRNASAAKSVGIGMDKYADIMKDVRDKMGDFMATGAGPMADFFENIAPKVGVTADQFKKLNGRDALQLYVDSLEKANVSQNEMTFYMEAIASDAALLQPLLADSGKEMERLGNRAEAAGAVMNQLDLAKMEQLQQATAKSQEVMTGLTNTIALQLAPVLNGVGDLMGEKVGGEATRMQKAVEKAFEFTVKGAGIVADGVRGIHVVVKGIEAAFWGMSAVAAEVFEQIARGVDDFVIKPALESLNTLIRGFNKIPGIELDELIVGDSAAVTKLTAVSDAATAKMRETNSELHDLLMKPLPSQALDDFVRLSQEKAEESARIIVETRNAAALAIPEIPEGEDPGAGAHKARLDGFETFRENMRKVAEEHNGVDEVLMRKHADKMAEIDETRFKNQMQGASQFFGDLSSLMNTESRALFEVGKAAAIAQAVVDGIAAAVSSFKFGAAIGGPVLGGAFASASALATGTQIAALTATSFDSGGGGSAGAAAPNVSVPNTAAPVGATQGQGGQGAGSSSTLVVEGISPDQLFSGGAVRDLAGRLIDFQRDGGQVVLT